MCGTRTGSSRALVARSRPRLVPVVPAFSSSCSPSSSSGRRHRSPECLSLSLPPASGATPTRERARCCWPLVALSPSRRRQLKLLSTLPRSERVSGERAAPVHADAHTRTLKLRTEPQSRGSFQRGGTHSA